MGTWRTISVQISDRHIIRAEFQRRGPGVGEFRIVLHTAKGPHDWLVRYETHGGTAHRHFRWQPGHDRLHSWPADHSAIVTRAGPQNELAILRSEVPSMDPVNLDLAHDIFQRALADPDAFPDELIVIPLALLAEGSLLSPSRLEMLRRLRRDGGYDRLQDLADDLGRGKHRVSKDISALASLGLVHKQRHGRQMRIAANRRPILLVD